MRPVTADDARTGTSRPGWSPPGPLLLTTGLAFLLGFLQKVPCHEAGWPWRRDLVFAKYCYSDIPMLYRTRGIADGIFPYAPNAGEHPLEYPVLTGLIMDWTGRLTSLFGPAGPAPDHPAGSRAYFLVNMLLLLGFALAVVAVCRAALAGGGGRGADALLVAAAPVLVLAGTINWDLVAVSAAVAALLCWVRGRWLLFGVFLGLGTAAKLYPAFLLGPALLLLLRDRRRREAATVTGAALVTWLAVNLPVALTYPDGWLVFWRFNDDRPADFGSLWYALQLLGHPVPAVNTVASGAFAALCAGVAVLVLARTDGRPAWQPTMAQLSFLVVAAFLLTNKVYSPQYVLWLLPLYVLARSGRAPRGAVLRDWLVWQAAEVAYWLMVWRYLAWLGDPSWLYPAVTIVRIVVTGYLCVQVVRDVVAHRPDTAEGVHPRLRTAGAY